MEYCRELAVPIEVFSNQNADAFLYNSTTGMTAPERWRGAKADVYGYVGELLAKATSQGALDQELTSDDKERLIAFLQDWGSLGSAADGYAYSGNPNRGYSVYPGGPGLGPACHDLARPGRVANHLTSTIQEGPCPARMSRSRT